jgi:uncharacterized cupredoxin-like copper-binding protein
MRKGLGEYMRSARTRIDPLPTWLTRFSCCSHLRGRALRQGDAAVGGIDANQGYHMTTRKMLSVLVATVVAASAASFGSVASASQGHDDDVGTQAATGTKPADLVLGTTDAPRDIAVTMTDNLRFDPGTIVVAEGETVRFLLDNPTAASHDFLIGDLEEQLHHHEEMAAGMGHDEMAADEEMAAESEGGLPPAITLEPGTSAEVIATFDEAGDLVIGCHVPGHWEAGMRGDIAVVPGDQMHLTTAAG